MVALRDTSGIRPTFNNLQNKTLYFSARIIRHTFIINILEYENVVVINILEKNHYFTVQTVHTIIKKQLIPCYLPHFMSRFSAYSHILYSFIYFWLYPHKTPSPRLPPHCKQRLPIIAVRAEQSLSMCSRGKYLRLSGRDLFSIEVQAVSLLILDYGLLNIVGPTVGLDDIAESLRKIMWFYRWLIFIFRIFFSKQHILSIIYMQINLLHFLSCTQDNICI